MNNRFHHTLLGSLLVAMTLLGAATAGATPAVTAWSIFKFPQPQPLCTGLGSGNQQYWNKTECGFVDMEISETSPGGSVGAIVVDGDGNFVANLVVTERTNPTPPELEWEFIFTPQPSWPSGHLCVRVNNVNGNAGNFGENCQFSVNALSATVAGPGTATAGSTIPLTGRIFQTNEVAVPIGGQPPVLVENEVPASFMIQLEDSSNNILYTSGTLTAAGDGTFNHAIPGTVTAAITTTKNLAVRVIDASYNDPQSGTWSAILAGSTNVTISPLTGGAVTIKNSFVSGVGWVKPGESYPWRVFVENTSGAAIAAAIVTIPEVPGMTFTNVTALSGAGTATLGGGSLVTWNIGTLAHGSKATLVVEAIADTAAQDPRIVWKDLSTTAELTWTLGGPLTSESHGPKVIPPLASYNSARFGDRPYVVVPADYTDRKHEAAHTGDALEKKLNSPGVIGSTFNLWQEVSLGQLYPNGAIGSAGVATADFSVNWNDPNRTDNEFAFSNNLPGGTCTGTDLSALAGSAAYPERISGGWYQLPRDTAYYGGDKYGTALIGALGGVGLIFAIDDACGPTGKAVYDAAHIADPEIDYNDYDSDKDGVVDFFMLVYVGTGGHGASQTSVPPYDNIWPHSSSLEFYFTDANGLKGYVTDDQLKSLKEIPQCYTDATRTSFDDCASAGTGGLGDDTYPNYVRVGPYNVNPEDSIDNASVISHEYGHSLGLPDFYCTGSKTCYGDWNLMSTDKSHHMDVFGKQEMGWIVPLPLTEGTTVANDWKESKFDTGEIHWQQPDGTPYTLSAGNGDQNIHNAEAYVVKLPAALVIDPALVANGASPDNVWWSGAGNDFGCPGHTFDFGLSPQEAPAGSSVSIDFASWWEIEWDWDYGFVLVSTDLGATWQSLPSTNAYTTPGVLNPNANGCQDQYGNGLTGTSGSYLAGSDAADRGTGSFTPATMFTPDNYTFVMPGDAEAGLLVRFAYATDPAVAGRGWFIDDLSASVNGTEVFSSNFENDTGNGRWSSDGFSLISATLGSQADRAYYMEMRDRTGFDHTGNGENDRAAIAFQPGLLLTITDEVVGYGNTGSGDFPNQSPVGATPQPGNNSPNMNDDAFTVAGVSHYNDTTGDGDDGWHDSYADGAHPSGDWVHDYNCLSFDVTAMSGTDVGPAYPIPGNLVGDVTFNIGPQTADNCGEFVYWPPMECFDADADGICDVDDNCPLVSNVDQLDQDLDSVGDLCDNCLLVPNADQCNTNSHVDNIGNVCDTDVDNNNITNTFDLAILRANFGQTGANDSDFNCNGIVNSFDLTIMRENFGTAPGPTGIAP